MGMGRRVLVPRSSTHTCIILCQRALVMLPALPINAHFMCIIFALDFASYHAEPI